MIIYGTKGKVTWTGEEPTLVPCSDCGQMALHPVVAQRYLHIFWIPLVPLNKQVFFECTHCRRSIMPKEAGSSLADATRHAKENARTPIHWFAGLALIAVMVAGVGFSIYQDDANTKEWVKKPKVGDYYVVDLARALPELKPGAFSYAVLRVKRVGGDSLDLELGTFGYSLGSSARTAVDKGDVRHSDYFAPDELSVTVAQLSSWQKDDTLYAVVRK